ncbi:uncharacterized protein BDZ83DRAFT_418887 [Colletotrichum acutatum]|uniref:Uncharacterized protein n=1 Tax=Glomerella acutata TaxID=27357 RepID=A0AAD8UL13_GLOAC|nr:uncharacterized protein BDZ83DRAFT_418887 [Colletotrichum acutatum]KAK1722425.1 hypothetical protein BDZ83DRAFT_418887 [Colletotrichum acutatum]
MVSYQIIQHPEAADDAATDVGRSLLHRAPDVLVHKQAGRVSDPSNPGRLKTSTASLVSSAVARVRCGTVGTVLQPHAALHCIPTHTTRYLTRLKVLCEKVGIHVSFRCLRMSHQCLPIQAVHRPAQPFFHSSITRLEACLGLFMSLAACQPHPSPPHLSPLRNGPLIHDGDEAFPSRQQTRERSLLVIKPRCRRDEFPHSSV